MSYRPVPFRSFAGGLCQCGCGRATRIASRTRASEGIVKGEPKRFVLGHNARTSPVDYLVDEAACWVWQRSIAWSGYGMAWRDGKHVLAHRAYYEEWVGPIPDGYQLDHLCRNRACVNPEHLEVTTRRQNVRRGSNAKLTEAQVVEIRERAEGCPVRPASRGLAPEYGVTPACVRDVLRGKTWKDQWVPT